VQQQYDEALARLDTAINEDPDNATPHNLKGEVLLLRKDYGAAAKAFAAALERKPDMVSAHRNLALARFAEGDREGAVEAFRAGIEATGSALLQVGLAGLYEGLGRTDEAIAVYERALENSPDSRAAANNLAMLLVTYQADAEGLARAGELVSVLEGATEAAYLDTLGWVRHKQGDHEAALEHLRAAVDKAPDSAEMNFHLAMALLEAGDQAGARQHLEKALAKEVQFREKALAEQTLADLTSAGE